MTHAYMLTASGGHFHFRREPTVRIDDIARHLAKSCRFLGATSAFYSIAQHAVLVSDIVATSKRDDNTPETRLYALLDSAHKAFMGEMSPLARQAMVDYCHDYFDTSAMCNPYDAVRKQVQAIVLPRLGFKWPPTDAQARVVWAASRVALATEVRDLMPDDPTLESWGLPAPHNRPIKPLPWPKAEDLFLQRWDELCALANHEVPHAASGKETAG